MIIEKNFPIPPVEKKNDTCLAKVEGMDVGDSILHPFYDYPDHTQFGRIKVSANYYGKRNGTAYEVRKMEDGIRVWRVK